MWRNLILLCCWVSLNYSSSMGQIYQPLSTSLDPMTQKALSELRSQITAGQFDGIEASLNRVINSSGYIKPLAEIYYRLAQIETDGNKAVSYYSTIIENWPDSAWAQKAFIDFIPLYLMSGGTLGADLIPSMWKVEAKMLGLAADADEVGVEAGSLKNAVLQNALLLANSRGDIGRLVALSQHTVSVSSQMKEYLELSKALSFIHLKQIPEARSALSSWIGNYPDSEYAPSAIYTLYTTLQNEQEKETVLNALRQQYPNTLESFYLREEKASGATN